MPQIVRQLKLLQDVEGRKAGDIVSFGNSDGSGLNGPFVSVRLARVLLEIGAAEPYIPTPPQKAPITVEDVRNDFRKRLKVYLEAFGKQTLPAHLQFSGPAVKEGFRLVKEGIYAEFGIEG